MNVKMKGYRTVAFNVVMGLGMIFGIDAAELEPAQVDLALDGGMALWGLGNVLLRAITNTSIFARD